MSEASDRGVLAFGEADRTQVERFQREALARLEADAAAAVTAEEAAAANLARSREKVDAKRKEVKEQRDKTDPAHRQGQTNSCGPAAARMVIASVTGQDVPEGQLCDEAKGLAEAVRFSEGSGMYEAGVYELLERHWVVPFGDDVTFDWLREHVHPGAPGVVVIQGPGAGHFIVVDGVSGSGDDAEIEYRNPWDGSRHRMGRKRFEGSSTRGKDAKGNQTWSGIGTDGTFPRQVQ